MARSPVVAVVLVLAVGACGGAGDGDPFHCGRVQPCGGDLVGSWKVGSSCLNDDAVAAEVVAFLGCRNVVTGSVTSGHGALVFAADLSFTSTAFFSGLASPTFPESCLGGRTCAELESFLTTEGFMVQDCMALRTSCTCFLPHVTPAFGGAGTYLATDGTLELRPDGVAPWSTQYCVTGSQMHIIGTNGATVLDDIVLDRQ